MDAQRHRLRYLERSDLEMLLRWRNSDCIREVMYSRESIAWDDHVRWFEVVRSDASRHPLIFERDDVPSGFVNIGPVRRGGVANWGFYASPDAPKGAGSALGHAALAHAFESLSLHKICGEALDFNERSKRLHARLGFQREGILKDQHFDGVDYHDVYVFGLTAETWRRHQREIDDERT